MKITQPIDTTAIASQHATAAAKNGPAASLLAKTSATKGVQSAGVAVTVSTMARSLEAANKSQSPDIDMAKVNSVRSAIAQGTYKVNPEAIADKLLSNAQEMLSRVRN